MRKKIPKEYLKRFVDPYTVGRKLTVMAQKTGEKIVNVMFACVVDKLMEGHIFDMGYGRTMFIGVIPNEKDKIAKEHKKKNVRWNTGRKRYSIVMEDKGRRLDARFRMPKRRRQELYDRIMSGQHYND